MTSKDDDDNLLDDSDEDRCIAKSATNESQSRLTSSRKRLQKHTFSETTSAPQIAESSFSAHSVGSSGNTGSKTEAVHSRLVRNKNKELLNELSTCRLKSQSQPISDIVMKREKVPQNAHYESEDDNILDDSDDEKMVLDKKAVQSEKGRLGSSSSQKNGDRKSDQKKKQHIEIEKSRNTSDFYPQRRPAQKSSDAPVSLDNIINSDSSGSNDDDLDCSENDGNESSSNEESEEEVGDDEGEDQGDGDGDGDDDVEVMNRAVRNSSRSSSASSSSSSCTASSLARAVSLFGPALTYALQKDNYQHFLHILLNHATWSDSNSNGKSTGNSSSGNDKGNGSSSGSNIGKQTFKSSGQMHGKSTEFAICCHAINTARQTFHTFLNKSQQAYPDNRHSADAITVDLFKLLVFAVEQGAYQCARLMLNIPSYCDSNRRSSSSISSSSSSSSSISMSMSNSPAMSHNHTHTPGRSIYPPRLPSTTASTSSSSSSSSLLFARLKRAVQECGVYYSIDDLLVTLRSHDTNAEQRNVPYSYTKIVLKAIQDEEDCLVPLLPPSLVSLLPDANPRPPSPPSTLPHFSLLPPPPPSPFLNSSILQEEIAIIIMTNNMIADENYLRSANERKKEVRNMKQKRARIISTSLFGYALAGKNREILHYICETFPFYVYGELRGGGEGEA
jgi:hypothetical protein